MVTRRRMWFWLVGLALLLIVVSASFAIDSLAVGWSGDRVQADPLLRSLRSLAMPLGKAELPLTIAFLVGLAGGRRRAAAALLAVVLTGVVVGVAKPAIGRARPNGEIGAFPSGDSAALAAVATPLVLGRPWLWPLAGAVVAGVGSFRVLDGMHHPSDVVAGVAIGLLLGAVSWLALRRRRLPSWRFFAAGAGVGLLLHGYGVLAASSERFLSGLAVYLPPFALVAVARFARVGARRWRGMARSSRLTGVVVVLVLVGCWLLAAGSTLWDRDEPRFARAAVEMLESGNWLVPTFNDELRSDKPVAIYWLMATSIRLFGATEWAVRMWSGVGLAVATWLAAGFVRRRLPQASPLVTAAALGLSPLAVVVGSAATTDGVLLAAVTAATVVLCAGCLDGWPCWRVVVLGGLLGGGLLVKGPVAVAVPGSMVVVWAILRARDGDQSWRRDALAFALALAIGGGLFVLWALPANMATGGELAAEGIGHHLVARTLRPLESHGGNLLLYLPYYPLVLMLGMLPWSAYLPAGAVALWRGQLVTPAMRRLLLAWILPMLGLLTLAATKLPHYLLPVLPAAAMVVALAVAARHRGVEDAGCWTAGAWLLRGLGTLAAVLLLLGAWWQPLVELRRFLVGLAFTVATSAWLNARLQGRRRQGPAVVTMVLAALIVILQLRLLLPELETLKPAPVIARAVRLATAPEIPVAAAGFREPSLAFYLGRSFTELADHEVPAWLAEPSAGVLITTVELLPATAQSDLEGVARRRGFNVAKGRWVEVVAVRRAGVPPQAAQGEVR